MIPCKKEMMMATVPIKMVFIHNGLNSPAVYEPVRFTTTINSSVINAFNPVRIALTGYSLYRERLTEVQVVGFILSFAGVLYVIFKGDWEALVYMKINLGELFMVGGISVW